MKILIDIPTDQYNEIVYVNYERLRDIVRDGVVIEKCEDAISRKAVDKIINKWLSHPDYELKDNIYDMTKKIHKLPSVTPLEAQPTDSVGMDKTKLDTIEQYLIDNVFENPDVMFNDECRGEEVDMVSIIAGMFEYLHIMVKGEPYEYMFHWANKIGAWVEEKRFDEMICRIMKEEQDE